jgi:NAD(P)-dependent dehydrogenase (short-subunit alcohol dehydrogenase family)
LERGIGWRIIDCNAVDAQHIIAKPGCRPRCGSPFEEGQSIMHTEPKVAIVTGGAGGIGEAAARAIARRGERVSLADLRPEAAEATAARLQAEGLSAEPVGVDVGSEASVRAMVEAVLGRWGRVDILVNNAGVESSKPFLDIGLEEYEHVMRVNVTGAWLCCQAVVPAMLRQGSGCIVNVSSVAGQRGGGLLGTAAYSTSKGAVIALTKALAREFAKSGIRVNAVSPSLTMTELAQRQLDRLPAGTLDRVIAMTPIGRVGQAGEIAAAIDFLTSDQASFIAGHVLNVDGGTMM